ncbi:MAG: hypothetical protein J7L11_01230 [Thermoprotei archaeon]|nr:hypothetical protein [Thermoprotei archaeon]
MDKAWEEDSFPDMGDPDISVEAPFILVRDPLGDEPIRVYAWIGPHDPVYLKVRGRRYPFPPRWKEVVYAFCIKGARSSVVAFNLYNLLRACVDFSINIRSKPIVEIPDDVIRTLILLELHELTHWALGDDERRTGQSSHMLWNKVLFNIVDFLGDA